MVAPRKRRCRRYPIPTTKNGRGWGHFVPPTDTTTTDDGGGVVEFKKTEPLAKTAPPQGGRPTKEAIAFADELASIAGYRAANTSDSWRKANPPQVVQVWLNELGKYERDLRQRPVDLVRNIANHVMARKRCMIPRRPIRHGISERKSIALSESSSGRGRRS